MTSDIIYVFRARGDSAALRYSLRSLANLEHGTVWIVGPRRPEWLTDEARFVRTNEEPGKWRNIPAALLAACRLDEVSEHAIYMNDDIFVLEPVEQVWPMHLGTWPEFSRRGDYRKGFSETEPIIRRLGATGELLSYEAHVPFPFEKGPMGELLAAVTERPRCLMYRSLYGNVRALGGRQIEDVKVRRPGGALPKGPFASTSDASWARGAGNRIRYLLSEPSRFERE